LRPILRLLRFETAMEAVAIFVCEARAAQDKIAAAAERIDTNLAKR
jgi:hypothetical protein